ncbi:MAG: SAM-dependent methyltransferase [Nanoarchaeota archaeon]
MNQIYILEHLDAELFAWSLIEYKRISKFVGKDNLWFTNIEEKDIKKLSSYGKVFTQSVKDMNLKDTCILDPEATQTLSPEDKSRFKYIIIGGILGDYPAKKRTEELITIFMPNSEKRDLGKEQLSTDNAAYVAHKILSGTPLSKIEFIDSPEIEVNEIESVILPFRYPAVKGKALMSKQIIKHLKERPGFD